ncbi:MAG: TrkH family potassium uptake protein [Spirochaetes bacterium]|jgi:trk system potassium uptake protein TrkH|nr:TrkH family potassium uptake protein [Spirochaetota bacterium]
MNPVLIVKTLSFLMLIISGFMLIPAAIALACGETRELISFIVVILPLSALSGWFVLSFRKRKTEAFSTRDGFIFVTASWLAASVAGSLPFIISGAIPSFPDAFFETVSGFSTTGASILTDVDCLPRSMLFWRSFTHWLGGMGIVVLAVAVLPLLGIGGLQLINAESPGPTVDRITPRIADTAKILWIIYIGFTVAQTALLMIAGMDLFDALTHTFGTLATGGFSTKNAGVGHYDSAAIEIIITVFMLLASISFSLHYRALTGRLRSLAGETEAKVFLLIFIISTMAVALSVYGESYPSFGESLRHAAFQAASILTTTGFATADFEQWPFFAQGVLFLLMFIGGSSGSTAGGIKVFRIVILLKQAFIEMLFLIHPRGIFTLKVNNGVVRKDLVYSVAGFFFLYIFMLLCTSLVVASSGYDLTTSLTTALATLGNIGPGFGEVGPTNNYAFFPDYVKWFLSFAMLVGRLELYTVLIILTPEFWRRR